MDADKQRALLQVTAHEANLIREMCQTEGFKILEKKFDEKLKKATSRLLDMSTTEEEIHKIRQQMFIWTEVKKMLLGFMRTGQYASKLLHDNI